MTIGRKIIGGYGVVLAMLLLVTISAFYSLNSVQEKYDEIIDMNDKLVDNSNAIRFEIRDQVAHSRGFLLYPDREQAYLGKLEEDHLRIGNIIKQMQSMPLVNESVIILNRVAELQKQFEQGQAITIEVVRQGKRAEALASSINDVLPISEQLMAETDSFRDLQQKRVAEIRTQAVAGIQRTLLGLAIMSLLGIIGALVISLYLSRAITRQLRETIAQLTTSSAEILATTTQVAAGSAETATAVSETTATVEEVKQTVQMASQKAKRVSDSAQQVATISETGRQAVEELIAGMERIREQTAAAAESIVRLSEQSQVIGEIILTVNDLAEQSNLLAVNAAIEAAKAGEQGKGFAVVAQEIKSLAEQSKQATTQVRAILGDIQKATGAAVMATDLSGKAVDAGVRQSDTAGEAIRMLADSISEAAQAALQIAASSQQQLVGMDQVALAMENIKQAITQNMVGTKQSEVAALNLHAQGVKLRQLIESN
ncbi:MAG: MCP four helix bundle domain-containing protein [Methylobacter sp.]|nr:MCP four helix bundle domain-containing protein [Methylobacter sp.]